MGWLHVIGLPACAALFAVLKLGKPAQGPRRAGESGGTQMMQPADMRPTRG